MKASRLGFESIRQLLQCRGGAVAVETAIVLLPLILLMLMTLETAIILAFQSNLNSAVAKASRQIVTGAELTQEGAQGSTGLSPLNLFISNLCANTVIPKCNSSRLQVTVTYGTPYSPPTSGSVQYSNPSGLTGSSYQTGASAACNLVLVQVYYLWPIMIPLNAPFLKNTSSSWTGAASYLMTSNWLAQNENAQGSSILCNPI